MVGCKLCGYFPRNGKTARDAGRISEPAIATECSLERFHDRYTLSGLLQGCRSLLVASTWAYWFRGRAILEPLWPSRMA
jgi:hypothetical protein